MRVTCVRVETFWISALHLLVETGAVELEYSREVFPLLRERRACVSCARSHAVRTLGSSIVSVYGRRQAEQLLVQSCGKGTGQAREPKSRMLSTAERPTHDEDNVLVHTSRINLCTSRRWLASAAAPHTTPYTRISPLRK